ncbi:MAG TPA: EamA family transporter [Candidatus Sulfotelmatobacter sp.]|nr:EamA family transporter [Candidatus Sulfotelmatobacter sp.]
MKKRIPVRVIWGLAAAILIDTLVQLSWKWVAAWLPADGGAQALLSAVLHRPYPLVVVAFMALQMTNWLKLLAHVDLSFAQPITALSYISVCLLSVFLFSEELGNIQIAGIACIILGVWFISGTDHGGQREPPLPHELEP